LIEEVIRGGFADTVITRIKNTKRVVDFWEAFVGDVEVGDRNAA
tara:strand:- start:1089 stop:1220 length:132 start_codon:yes stop_codon:yes gene_type:complete